MGPVCAGSLLAAWSSRTIAKQEQMEGADVLGRVVSLCVNMSLLCYVSSSVVFHLLSLLSCTSLRCTPFYVTAYW